MSTPNHGTLFHLVPLNEAALEALSHPENRRFVSKTASDEWGLEIGFHVAKAPSRVITRLGRDTDLLLERPNVSARHAAFEMDQETLLVLLCTRTTQANSVFVTPLGDRTRGRAQAEEKDEVSGACFLEYGKGYQIDIADYRFGLVWRSSIAADVKQLAVDEYQAALHRECNVRPRDLPTEIAPEDRTWHHTRIHTGHESSVVEAQPKQRKLIGVGTFSRVYSAIKKSDTRSVRETFAVKVIHLNKYPDIDSARASAHSEIKALENLKHPHIVGLLGYNDWHTDKPEIFMPLAQGNLALLAASLAKSSAPSSPAHDELARTVLGQMLSALDHLAYHGMCHRDVKPQNILYFPDEGPVFKLADFGLAIHQKLATPNGGTKVFQAPEQHSGCDPSKLGPKMDVWSLLATIAAIHPKYNFPPPDNSPTKDILAAVHAAAQQDTALIYMAREDPEDRASAAQMLVHFLDSRGLTTPRSKVPKLLLTTPPASPVLEREPVPATPTTAARSVLVQYPRHNKCRQTPYAGAVKRKKKARLAEADGVDEALKAADVLGAAEALRAAQAAQAAAPAPSPLSADMDWERSKADVDGYPTA